VRRFFYRRPDEEAFDPEAYGQYQTGESLISARRALEREGDYRALDRFDEKYGTRSGNT